MGKLKEAKAQIEARALQRKAALEGDKLPNQFEALKEIKHKIPIRGKSQIKAKECKIVLFLRIPKLIPA